MTLKITGIEITSDVTKHKAYGPGFWQVSWLSGRDLKRDQAIAAMHIADVVPVANLAENASAWGPLNMWAAQLGMTGPEAVKLVKEATLARMTAEAESRRAAEKQDDVLRGPWVAVLAGEARFLIDPNDLDEYLGKDDPSIHVVRGSAVPKPDDDNRLRMPVEYDLADVLYEYYGFDSDAEVVLRWDQAQAVVAALNARAYSL